MNELSAKDLAERGQQLQEAGEIEQAISCYRQAIELDNSCYDYYYQLGRLLQEQDLIVQAALYYEEAIAIDHDRSWAYHSLAEIFTQQQQLESAIDYYHLAIKLNPEFSWSHYNLGRILHQQNKLELAITCYENTIKYDPKYSWSYYHLGEIYNLQNHLQLAENNYRQAIELNPNSPHVYCRLGKNLQQQSRLTEAIACYQQVIQLDPKHFWGYYFLAEVWQELTEFERAINYYQQALDLNHSYFPGYVTIGAILIHQGETAIEEYRQKIVNKSELLKAYTEIGLGKAWEQQTQFEKTIECYQNAIAIKPDLKLPYKLLQHTPINPDNYSHLIDFYQKITQIVPDSVMAWGNLGDIYTGKNQLIEAIKCYQTSCYYNAVAEVADISKIRWQLNTPKKPDFMIIGESKCGTSSLFEYLRQHPQILLPHKKEINFFDRNFDFGTNWYLAHFPAIAQLNGEPCLTGEATPHYFGSRTVDQRIFEFISDVKLIIMVRNPVDRTISDYYHHFNRGVETRSLTEIIKSSQQYLATVTPIELEYTNNETEYILKSIYVYKIRRWMKLFPPENILILKSESFFNDIPTSMERVFGFLNLPNHQENNYTKHNIGSYRPVSDEIKQKLTEIFQAYPLI